MPTKKHKGKFTRRHPPTSSRKAKKDKKKKGKFEIIDANFALFLI